MVFQAVICFMRLIILIFFMILAWTPLSGENLEFSLILDGAMRWHGLMLYKGPVFSSGASYMISSGEKNELVAGLNTVSFSIGHLGDTGLASELRNPGSQALSRLAEKTIFRADLRSTSLSRMGLALMSGDFRMGAAWERRKDIDAGILWAVPVLTDTWSLEFLGEAGLLREVINDDVWFPDSSWRAGGPFTLISGRLRQFHDKGGSGLTFILSGGVNLMPGWLGAISSSYSYGPWRIRWRGVYSSEFFRNADGRRLIYPIGSSFDCRFRPSTGLQFTLDYNADMEVISTELRRFSDGGSIAVGWRFGELQISLESDWNNYFSDRNGVPSCRRIKGRLMWDRQYIHMGLLGTYEPLDGWSIKLENAFPAHGLWLLETYAELHKAKGPLLLDLRIKGRWDVGKNRFIITVFTGDIGRDWQRGPESSSDFKAEIRWIRRF